MTLWETIMSKSPTMKQLIEDKIAEEIGKKQTEIEDLKAKLELTQSTLDELILNRGAE